MQERLVSKLPYHQTTLAKKKKKCTEIGLKAFGINVSHHEIKLETYIPIKCCMRCYALEDHFTNECPKTREYKVCSECSTEGHVWHQYLETYKKCLNCGGNHSTLAMKCSKRKEILNEKRTQENERQKLTYPHISQATLPSKMPNYKMPEITKK